MEQILLINDFLKETVTVIMMLYKNTKVKVHSPNGKTDNFNIIAGVLQGDTLAPYLLIISLDYVLRTSINLMKENSFKLAKERTRRYPAQTITDADYTDDIALLATSPTQAETCNITAGGIGLHVKADKTEYMCFNQRGYISTLKGGPLKLMDKFTYLGSSVSSTKNDINTRLAKALTAIDKLLVMWKSNPTNKIKRSFFQAPVMSILLYGCTTRMLTKCMEKKFESNYTRMLRAVLNKKHPTKQQLYGHLPLITKTIQVR